MPYRRLPKTDQARLRALKTAVQTAGETAFTEQVLTYKTLNEAKRFLLNFEGQVSQYSQNFQTKVSANKTYKHSVANAKMYISHFIQVLNLAVIRGDIKKEQKELYHLDTENHVLPDLVTEDDLLKWGQYIIDGEMQRQSKGGFPIYNPSIAKVKVYYDIFKEQHVNQEVHKRKTFKLSEDIVSFREEADKILLDIWNQVEEYYKNYLPYARLTACEKYGLIYYYRKGEKKITPETDLTIQKVIDQSPTLDFGV